LIIHNEKLIVCDTGNKRIQLFDLSGNPLSNLGPDEQKDFAPIAIAPMTQDKIIVYDRATRGFLVLDLANANRSRLKAKVNLIHPTHILESDRYIHILDYDGRLYRLDLERSNVAIEINTKARKPILLLKTPADKAAYLFRTPMASQFMNLDI